VTVSGLLVVRAPLRHIDPSGHEEDDVIDKLKDSGRFCDSIMLLLAELAKSSTGMILLEFLLDNPDITIAWASETSIPGATFKGQPNVTGQVINRGEIFLNTETLAFRGGTTIGQNGEIIWTPDGEGLIDQAVTLGHELFHVLQDDYYGGQYIEKAVYGSQGEYNAYVVTAKIAAELRYGGDRWNPNLTAKYSRELVEFYPLRDVSISTGEGGFDPRDVNVWRALLFYPPQPPGR